ncbi:MAG: MOSC domain-containing protein [Bacteroidetes bacterium]|jgi:MOSC domain-containing protein YiiM|nr:MOSC domain-containing protein [Bacteroidota bacterium]
MIKPRVISLSKSDSHTFNKYNCEKIKLLEGLGVEGDAHSGKTVKHRSRVAADPMQPNLRQVHLIHSELFDELAQKDFVVVPGAMGENITTQGIDLLNLPKNTILKIGTSAAIQITGLRNPCSQLESIKKGLMNAVLDKDDQGNLIRKAGIMGIVLQGGDVFVGDEILIQFPNHPYEKLEKV